MDGDDLIEKHRELMGLCKQLTNTSAADEILKMQGGLAWSKVLDLARSYRLKGTLVVDEHEKMNRLQKAIFNELKLAVRTKHENNISGTQDSIERETIQVD
jgi:hypothetical protein